MKKRPDLGSTVRFRLENEEDFVHCPSLENNLKNILDRNPNGCTDRVISALLQINIDEIESRTQEVVEKLRTFMVDNVDVQD